MTERPNEPSVHNASGEKPTLTIDWKLYAEHLEDSDLTDDQKREFIETLWSIVLGFIDLGFSIHPLQQVDAVTVEHDACDQNAEIRSMIAEGMIDLEEFPTIDMPELSNTEDVLDSSDTNQEPSLQTEKGDANAK